MEDVKVSNDEKLDISNKEDQEQQKTEGNKIDQLNELLKDENIKSEYHRRIDLEVNKRLEKRLSKELEKAERERQTKAEKERQAKEEEKKIKQYEKEIEKLNNIIKYKSIIEKSGLNTDLIDFLANGTTTEEEVIKNIDRFKELLRIEVQKELSKKWINNPIPEKSEGEKSNKKNKLWNI